MHSHSVEGVVRLPNLRARAPNIGVVIASSVHLVREGLATTLRRLSGVMVLDAVDFGPASIERIAGAKPDIVIVDLGRTRQKPSISGALSGGHPDGHCPHAEPITFIGTC